MFHAVCFDLFHTLIDVGTTRGTPGRYTADILGLDREDWNRACFSGAHDITSPTDHREVVRAMAHSLDPSISLSLIHEAADERRERFDYTLRNVDDGVLEVLAGLRARGLRLGLISNASTGEVSAWPDSPLAGFFDAAVFSCHCGYAKPDVRIYRHTLELLGAEPARTAFVGDGGSDEHAGAAEAGLFGVMTTEHIGTRFTEDQLARRGRHARARVDGLARLSELLERTASAAVPPL